MQLLVIASALLSVALGQYVGYPGYQGYTGYPGYNAGYLGYRGYPAGYAGYPGYSGYAGYTGYPGYAGYPGYRGYPQLPVAVKPVDSKTKEVSSIVKAVVPVVPAVAPVLPALAPIAPIVPKTAWSGPFPAIRSQTQGSTPDGSYSWSYETENGIAAAESGAARLGPLGEDDKVVVGEYAYTSPEGKPIHVRYTADANGFHPEIISSGVYDRFLGVARVAGSVDPVVPVAVSSEPKSE